MPNVDFRGHTVSAFREKRSAGALVATDTASADADYDNDAGVPVALPSGGPEPWAKQGRATPGLVFHAAIGGDGRVEIGATL